MGDLNLAYHCELVRMIQTRFKAARLELNEQDGVTVLKRAQTDILAEMREKFVASFVRNETPDNAWSESEKTIRDFLAWTESQNDGGGQ